MLSDPFHQLNNLAPEFIYLQHFSTILVNQTVAYGFLIEISMSKL